MPQTTLVSTEIVAARLDDPLLRLIDCRFKLDDTSWGEREYEAAHIPGAVYAHLDRDLSGAKTGTNGRHPLPSAADLAATFGRFGIGDEVQVVAYDQANGMFASRLWWLLRWMGHRAVAVLDGGLAKWRAEHLPMRSGIEQAGTVAFHGAPHDDMVVDARSVATSKALLLDARAPERYRGETEPLDRVPGHIPGARNYFFQQNVGAGDTFLAPDTLRGQLTNAIGEASPGSVICYCGSGVTACHNLLAMEHAGLTGARLYPGSWSEWCADPARPVETGNRS
jgi:thiosulfate/3-mercaptopyruvate sulfurtransferase